MVVICLGPVCIPVWGLLPFIVGLLVWQQQHNCCQSGEQMEQEGKKKEVVALEEKPKVEESVEDQSSSKGNSLVTDGKVVVLKDKEHWEKLIEGTKTDGHALFVDFTAVWCGPCRVISPVFDELAAKHTNALFVKVDVDKHAQVAQECNISAMPTFKAFKNGMLAGEMVGADKNKLSELVKNHA